MIGVDVAGMAWISVITLLILAQALCAHALQISTMASICALTLYTSMLVGSVSVSASTLCVPRITT